MLQCSGAHALPGNHEGYYIQVYWSLIFNLFNNQLNLNTCFEMQLCGSNDYGFLYILQITGSFLVKRQQQLTVVDSCTYLAKVIEAASARSRDIGERLAVLRGRGEWCMTCWGRQHHKEWLVGVLMLQKCFSSSCLLSINVTP